MKWNILHKFCLIHKQNGIVLIFTILLLLIITILTIAFLYLQFLEVDLIAYETENLQAFYLANAGLVQGIKEFKDRPKYIRKKLEESGPTYTFIDPNSYNQIKLASNKKGTFYSKYIKDTSQSNNEKYSITIVGIGLVNDKTQTKRELEKRANLLSSGLPGHGDLPDDDDNNSDNDFPDLIEELDHSVVTSIVPPNLQGEKVSITHDRLEDQTEVLTKWPEDPQLRPFSNTEKLSQNQTDAIKNFDGKNKILKARRLDQNDNRLLFVDINKKDKNKSDNIYNNYDDFVSEEGGINSSNYGANWNYVFDYTENRSKRLHPLDPRTAIEPVLTLNERKEIILQKGLYIFKTLTLKEGSIISTQDDVLIYTTALKLEKEAQLIGGSIDNPNPNHLIIMAEYWVGYPFNSSINRINIGPGACVRAHIFAPNLDVYLARGSSKDTTVEGSILTRRLVAYKAQESFYGTIKINYGAYLPEVVEEVIGSWQEVRSR